MAVTRQISTLIGDLVGSKESTDRSALQRALEGALVAVNVLFDPPQPLEPTVGDEFQGGFSSVQEAARASLMLRLELFEKGSVDSRYGLGYGAVSVLGAESQAIQDGPGWWSARTAITQAKHLANSPRTSFARTSFSYWEAGPEQNVQPADASTLNAYLLCRDAIVSQMAARSRRILLGLLLGRTQLELAEEEQVTQSAISQNLTRSGAFAVEAAQRRMEDQLR